MTRFSQGEAARQVGITRERLASYEDSRVCLKVGIALKICRQLIIGERWLAEGGNYSRSGELDNPKSGMKPLPECKNEVERLAMDLASDPVIRQFPEGTLFSEAWDQKLKARYQDLMLGSAGSWPRIMFTTGDNPELVRNYLDAVITYELASLNPRDQFRVLHSMGKEVRRAAQSIREGYWSEAERELMLQRAFQKGTLKPEEIEDLLEEHRFLVAELPVYLAAFGYPTENVRTNSKKAH